jgi:transposase InsO family protein
VRREEASRIFGKSVEWIGSELEKRKSVFVDGVKLTPSHDGVEVDGEILSSSEVAEKHNIAGQRIRLISKQSFNDGIKSILVGSVRYFMWLENGTYRYVEKRENIIEIDSQEANHKAWVLASTEEREKVQKRLGLIKEYINRNEKEGWKAFLSRVERKYKEIKPSKSKLFRWLEAYKESEKSDNNLLWQLLDKRGKDGNNRSWSDEQWNAMEIFILENPDIRIGKVHEYLKMEFGEKETPSYSTVNRMMESFKSKNMFLYEVAKDPNKAMGKLRPAPGRADEGIIYKNQLWELDATPADVVCNDGKRYALSACIDVFSRRVVVVVEPTASSMTHGKMFRKAIKTLGVPHAVLTDNGRDYTSNHFSFICQRLKCEQRLTPPFSGWAKPHIERFFGTLARDLFEECTGYIGHNVADRERISNRQTFAKKLESQRVWREKQKNGNEFAKKFALKKENLGIAIDIPMSRDELEVFIDKWIKIYEYNHHRGINTKPIDRWNSCDVAVDRVSDERILDILVGLSEQKSITKKGVTFAGVVYWHDDLYDMVGSKVWVLSDDELGYVYLYSLEFEFIAKAENAEMIGRSRKEYIASRKMTKKITLQIERLEEIRREAPNRIAKLVEKKLESIEHLGKDKETKTPEVALEFKSNIVKEIRESFDKIDKEQKAILNSDKPTLVVGGRPLFHSLYERFLWDLEHESVDENTERLKAKKPAIFAMAYDEYIRRKAG